VTASLPRRALFALATSERLEQIAPRDLAWRRLGARYVAGITAEDALRVTGELAGHGIAASIDRFGEHVTSGRVADRVLEEYLALAALLPDDTWLSLDLSHIAFSPQRLAAIVDALPDGGRLQIGAEEAAVTDRVLDTLLSIGDPGHVCATVQANLRRSWDDLERLSDAGIMVRLVKGAYVEPDALPYGDPTDLAYLGLARRAADLDMQVSLATHHGLLREACRELLPEAPVEMLLGVRPDEAERLADDGVNVRVYVPYGPDWFRYVMRRVAEAQGA
jgi:proline dehydrogenase